MKDHEKYKELYLEASEWIRKARLEVQRCSDLHTTLENIKDKEIKVTEIKSSLPECDSLVHRTIEQSIVVLKTTGSEGQIYIKEEIEVLNNDWEGLQVICKETDKALKKCIQSWNDYADTYKEMKKWIEDQQSLVDDETEADKKSPQELEKCRGILEKIIGQKLEMEKVNDLCEALTEQSACTWIRDQTVQLQGLYTNLLTSAQSLVSKIEKGLSDHTEFLKAKQELESWLQTAHGTVQDSVGVGSEKEIKEKLETVRLVSTRMTEGQHLLTVLQDAFAKVINNTQADKQEVFREDVQNLRNSWDTLSMDVTSIQAQLKSHLARWDDYNESKRQMENWLGEMENALLEGPNSRGELGEMKTLLERYKNLLSEVTDKESNLNRLRSEGGELSSWAKQGSVLDEVNRLRLRYEKVSNACKVKKEEVESEIQEYNQYHQSLQETEKWLLQVSFHLMAHNSLYITNREQTEEQIAQHEILLDDIRKYQATLDEVKNKGQGQIARYGGAPGIRDAIEKQLNNVQDSYNSLLQTALQIKNRLCDSLAKFKEYEDTLESIMVNLDEYEPVINEALEKPAVDLEDAQKQLEAARVNIFLDFFLCNC